MKSLAQLASEWEGVDFNAHTMEKSNEVADILKEIDEIGTNALKDISEDEIKAALTLILTSLTIYCFGEEGYTPKQILFFLSPKFLDVATIIMKTSIALAIAEEWR